MNSAIEKIYAREILDSRGNPTVEVDVSVQCGIMVRAAVPSGASTGDHEAIELRDGDETRYLGKGVRNVVNHINITIADALKGFDATKQIDVDHLMIDLDGTENKSNLGANALLGVSMAVARTGAKLAEKSLFRHLGGDDATLLPVPMMNILNGGSHADNSVDIQEFMVVPFGASTFSEALRMGTEVFHHLKSVLKSKDMTTSVGDEGGFAPNLPSNAAALDVILQAVELAGLKIGQNMYLALDCAASEFHRDGKYRLKSENKTYNSSEFADYLQGLAKRYPILSIEDGMDESDWVGWAKLSAQIGDKVQLVGDDLFVTNTSILQRGVIENVANSILIKFNQIGSLTETLAAINMAKKAGYTVVISHRSGETGDTTIADLAVGTAAGQIKTGSLCRSDRVAKYNRLLRIEEELGDTSVYNGLKEFERFTGQR